MSEGQNRGTKRSKAFYRKSAYGNKQQKTGANVLQPGIRGFLVMCNSNESNAVRESYNILNEYGDLVFGRYKPQLPAANTLNMPQDDEESDDDEDCEDVEKAVKKEVASIKNVISSKPRFQNVTTKAKNCVFIRTTVDDPVKLVTSVMEDVAERKLKRARYAARMLPIIGTCKAQTEVIAKLAKEVLKPYICPDTCENPPKSFTIIFKSRNNNGTSCGKESVIPDIREVVLAMNPNLVFSWSDYEVAILVEVVCNVCCLGLAPGFHRLRKYNFQELSQGSRLPTETGVELPKEKEISISGENSLTKQSDSKSMSAESWGNNDPLGTSESEQNSELVESSENKALNQVGLQSEDRDKHIETIKNSSECSKVEGFECPNYVGGTDGSFAPFEVPKDDSGIKKSNKDVEIGKDLGKDG